MDSSLAWAKYAIGLQQGFKKKKKKDFNMSDIKNTFYTVCKAGLLNKVENGLKRCFRGGFLQLKGAADLLKFCLGKQVYQEQCNS